MRIPFISLLIAVILIPSATFRDCLAGIIRHDRDAARYRALGEDPKFQSMGEVTSETIPEEGENEWRPSASAVLIAPQWVLTVAHMTVRRPLAEQRYAFAGEKYRAVSVVLSPGFDPKARGEAGLPNMAKGADLALVRLDRPVLNVTPAVRYRGRDEVGRVMTKVGYGCIGDGLAGMTLPLAQERRGGNNVIDAAGGKFQNLTVSDCVLICDFDHPSEPAGNQLGEPDPVDLEIGLSVGDSGCGWFVEEGGKWELAAINSGMLPNKGEPRTTGMPKYGSVMAGMRVSSANDWIDGVLAEPEPAAK